MRKNLNKLATLALTGMMVAGMSFGAMADTAEGADQAAAGSWSSTAPTLGRGETVSIKKQIKLINHTTNGTTEDGKDVPDVVYTYTIEPETNPGKIGEYQVEKGEAGALMDAKEGKVTETISFTDEDGIKSGVVTKNLEITFDSKMFTGAGVYRYRITEINPETSDITYDRSDDTLYLDVYVDTEKGITAYVLLDSNENRSGDATADAGAKKEGYTVEDSSGEATTAGDVYNTYDLNVEKVIEGNNSIKNLTFEFVVTLSKTENGVDKVVDSWKGKRTQNEVASGEKRVGVTMDGKDSNGYGAVSYDLSDSGEIEIKNIPASATFTVKETNSSVNTFVVGAAGATLDSADATGKVTMTQNKSAETTSTSFTENGKTAAKTVTLTNTYKSTPVTGVAMNIAPYAAMVLGAGAFAGIFLGGKRRKTGDED